MAACNVFGLMWNWQRHLSSVNRTTTLGGRRQIVVTGDVIVITDVIVYDVIVVVTWFPVVVAL